MRIERQIDSGLYERCLMSPSIVSTSLTQIHPKAKYLFRDTYVLEFLDLPQCCSENDLRKEIIRNLRNFILEVGKDFAFYRRRIQNSRFHLH